MTWGTLKLKDGSKIPQIAWGSWRRGNGQDVIDYTEQAIEAGFSHIDTAQAYQNQAETGQGIKESGEKRKNLWVTTKWSRKEAKIRESLDESLKFLGMKYVDLYLIHSPALTSDPVAAFGELEWLKQEGYIKHAGVSNFEVKDLEKLRHAGCDVEVNQIYLTPSVYERQRLLMSYHEAHGIVTEAYSVLRDLTEGKGGIVDKTASKIAAKMGVDDASMILLAWARAKGVVIVTSSTSKQHLDQMMRAGDIELSKEDEQLIDEAGKKAFYLEKAKTVSKFVGGALILAGGFLVQKRYFF